MDSTKLLNVNIVFLFRLRGHKNAITDLKFLEKDGRALVSSSKDFLVKIWDLETQHCIQTLVGHRAEVWSFDVNPEETRLVTVCDKQIRFYKLGPIEKAAAKPAVQETDDNTDSAKMDVDVQAEILEETDRRAIFYGIIDRKVDERAQLLRFHPDGSMFAIQSSGKAIEFLQVHNEDERKNKKRRRKRREKKKVEQEDPAEAANVDVEDLPSDEYSHKQVLRTTHKIQSFGFPTDTSKEVCVIDSFGNINDT
jgi:U3 small nucleolar RNA-associated protein 12